MSYKILLTEDDKELCEIVNDYFTDKSGGALELVCAHSGEQAEEYIYETDFDLVMLDVMLPDKEGFELCRALRRESDVPIIFLTARQSEEDVLYGYSLGCDDYISKPFSLARLYAKVNALIRRSNGMVREEIMTAGEIQLNPYRYRVGVSGEETVLAPKEYAVLKMLMRNKNNVVTREKLLIKIWGYDYGGSDRVVDTHIKKLRKALGSAGKQIRTVVSKGYRLEG